MKLKARLKLGGSRDGIKTKMLKLASYEHRELEIELVTQLKKVLGTLAW